MGGRAKKNLILLTITGYCALSCLAMHVDYWAVGSQSSQVQQAIHLGFTVVVLLGLTLWKGRSIEVFVSRLSALPQREVLALFAVAGMLVLTMLDYPRNQMEFTALVYGLMESTRALVALLFLAGTTVGLTCIIALNAPPAGEAVLRLAENLFFRPSRRAFIGCAMLIMFLETNAISYFQFHHVPICSDEVCYIFQAKIFASGRLYATPPPYPEAFRFVSFVLGDKWYSIVAPGYPVLLIPGVFLGATWVVNPFLAALCVMLIYLVAVRAYDERIARGAAVLILVSPFVLMLSSVQLSHISTTFFFLLFLYLLMKGLDQRQWFYFSAAGLALGGMALTRPLNAMAVAVPWGMYTVWLLFRRRLRLTHAFLLGFGLAIPTAFLLAYNYATNGDPLTFGYTALYGKNFRLGFVTPPSQLSFARHEHTPLRGLINLSNGFYGLNRYLFGWPLPSLLFALTPFALPSKNKWDYLLLGTLLSIPALYFFFFHQDFFMGPRYYFDVAPAAVILTARGIREAPSLWNRLAGWADDSRKVPGFLAVLLTICVVFNAALFFPERLRVYDISSPIHQGVPAPIWRYIESQRVHNAVVFINDFFSLAYGTGLWRNDPELRGDIIYARDGISNESLMALYPGRRYYRYVALSDTFEEIFPVGKLSANPSNSSR